MDLHGDRYVRDFTKHSVDAHVQWLLEKMSHYLKTNPSIAVQLARNVIRRGIKLRFEQIISQWERVSTAHRRICKVAFGADIIDRYFRVEAGWLALQCREQGNLHVVSPSVCIEILDEAGKAWPPGAVGRVLITCLHNLVMPIIRYDLGD